MCPFAPAVYHSLTQGCSTLHMEPAAHSLSELELPPDSSLKALKATIVPASNHPLLRVVGETGLAAKVQNSIAELPVNKMQRDAEFQRKAAAVNKSPDGACLYVATMLVVRRHHRRQLRTRCSSLQRMPIASSPCF